MSGGADEEPAASGAGGGANEGARKKETRRRHWHAGFERGRTKANCSIRLGVWHSQHWRWGGLTTFFIPASDVANATLACRARAVDVSGAVRGVLDAN